MCVCALEPLLCQPSCSYRMFSDSFAFGTLASLEKSFLWCTIYNNYFLYYERRYYSCICILT